MSTPRGKRGWFYQAYLDAKGPGSGWAITEVPADRCPRISQAWLELERSSLGAQRYASEYECRFVEDEVQVFGAFVDDAMTSDFEPLDLGQALGLVAA